MVDTSLTNSATGNSALASTTATFGFTASAGRLLILFTITDAYKTGDPSGWTLPTGGSIEGNHGHYVFYKVANGSETDVIYTISGANTSTWWVGEFDNVATTSSLDTSTSSGGGGGAGFTTASITPTAGPRAVLALIGVSGTSGFLTGMSGWTNSFVEVADFRDNPGGTQHGGGVAMINYTADGVASTNTNADFSSSASYRSGTVLSFVNQTPAPSWTWSNTVRMG